MEISVAREKIYHRGRGWTWHYTVTVPGEPHTFGHSAMHTVRAMVKRNWPNATIIEDWKR